MAIASHTVYVQAHALVVDVSVDAVVDVADSSTYADVYSVPCLYLFLCLWWCWWSLSFWWPYCWCVWFSVQPPPPCQRAQWQLQCRVPVVVVRAQGWWGVWLVQQTSWLLLLCFFLYIYTHHTHTSTCRLDQLQQRRHLCAHKRQRRHVCRCQRRLYCSLDGKCWKHRSECVCVICGVVFGRVFIVTDNVS